MCFPKTLASTILALGVFLCLVVPWSGEEGGAGDYLPGLYASLINITPNKPGFGVGTGYLFYTGSAGASATLPFGGILASDINADISLADLSLTWQTPLVAVGPKGAGKSWLAMFRFYGPDKSLFEKTWKLPDIERVN